MGVFSQPFCQATTQAGTMYSATGPLFSTVAPGTSVPGVVSQRAACVRVQPWYGVRMPCVLGGT